jgi:ATP-dependent Clp protease ATP-binding subunit ClpA
VFQNQEMPRGTTPSKASVGFERDASQVVLQVRGIQAYRGAWPEVGEWLLAGSKGFVSFAAMRDWIRGPLAKAYSLSSSTIPEPEELTDFKKIKPLLPQDGTGHAVAEDTLRESLLRQVRGQDQVVRVAARRVSFHTARTAPARPLTLFSVGPTGVGKTLLAESLASALSELGGGHIYKYLRLDMSEYQEAHRVSQLIGAPQGYVGYQDGAQLVDTLAQHPRAVVLFDEIEKAHPDILRCLMNAMDAGRISRAVGAGTGRAIDCRQAIFCFTSNLDCEGIMKDLEDLDAFDDQPLVDRVCRKRLRDAGVAPELVGRISAFLAFRQLGTEAIAEVVTLSVARAAREFGLEVRWIEPEVINKILEQMPGEGFGARPFEYLVGDLLGDALTEAARQWAGAAVSIHAGPPFKCMPWVPLPA